MDYEIDFQAHDLEEVENVTTIVQNSPWLDELLRQWVLEQERTLTLCTGIDDNHEHTLVTVILSLDREEIGCFYIPIAEISARYTDLQPVSCGVKGKDHKERAYIEDEDYFDRRDGAFGARYDDHLCATVFPIESIIPLALTYAICDLGEAVISLMSEDSRNDCSLESTPLAEAKIGTVYLHYKARGESLGMAEHVHFVLPQSGIAAD